MTEPPLPHQLRPVTGPFPADKVEGAVAALGHWGPTTAELVDRGLVPPDLLVGCTLRLLANQLRRGTGAQAGAGEGTGDQAKASPIAGGVWVRERVSFHHPVALSDEVVITGETVRRYVRKGRSYSTSVSQTRDRDGRLLVSNITTGLTEYRADPSRAETDIGTEPPPIMPEHTGRTGETPVSGSAPEFGPGGRRLEPGPLQINLAMMQARDGARSDNPIHSDLEVARRAGLPAPIAGGSHVLAFALELVVAEWGADALLAGSHVDVRWLGQVRAGDTVRPTVEVRDASTLHLTVEGTDRTCLVADLMIAR